ncbi:MAG: hypothetical protein GF307_11635 [candidate division Zixibacteria bacterium]|nr:hypothetical protein [candidate division Zixibacteria bacterium]
MNIKIHPVTLHFKRPFKLSRGTTSERTNVIVDINGHPGEGAPVYYAGQTLEEVLAGAQDVLDMLGTDDGFERLHTEPWPREVRGFPSASLCAVTQAVYGYLAARKGVPFYESLGLEKPEDVVTSYSIEITNPDNIEGIINDYPDFKAYKLKLGSENDIDTVKAFRKVKPDVELRVDVNGGWTVDEALEKIRILEQYNLELIEQPLPVGEHEGLDRLTSTSFIPIIVDEDINNFEDVLKLHGIVHGINVKLSKCGNIFDTIRIMQYAKQVGMKVQLGCMVESSVGITAALHLASLADYIDLDGNLLVAEDPYKGVITENGLLNLPEGNGLGVTLK